MEDQRDVQRQRTLKGGRIVFNNNQSTINCTVRNLSSAGAQLKVASVVGIPDQFRLLIGDESHDCTVAWKRETEVGVKFT